ncbi:hypothetical protein SOPP22_00020 [Shewanella sp. OPT22]|nr:hypothetical protein SOPP22_00020 [Shewanella sp. OPT22]
MQCRLGCGACCIAPSISSSIPGMPNGKKAGDRCINLSDENLCKIFGHADRPKVCEDFKATKDACGETNQQAMEIIAYWENVTG